MTVYHGSRKGEFDCFDPSKGNPCSSGALYFSNSLEFAKKFSGSKGHNYEVYLRITNPLRDGFDGSGATMSPNNYRDGGIFIKRQTDKYATKGTKEFIVFDPVQIKSVNNNGEFNPNSNNINK